MGIIQLNYRVPTPRISAALTGFVLTIETKAAVVHERGQHPKGSCLTFVLLLIGVLSDEIPEKIDAAGRQICIPMYRYVVKRVAYNTMLLVNVVTIYIIFIYYIGYEYVITDFKRIEMILPREILKCAHNFRKSRVFLIQRLSRVLSIVT